MGMYVSVSFIEFFTVFCLHLKFIRLSDNSNEEFEDESTLKAFPNSTFDSTQSPIADTSENEGNDTLKSDMNIPIGEQNFLALKSLMIKLKQEKPGYEQKYALTEIYLMIVYNLLTPEVNKNTIKNICTSLLNNTNYVNLVKIHFEYMEKYLSPYIGHVESFIQERLKEINDNTFISNYSYNIYVTDKVINKSDFHIPLLHDKLSKVSKYENATEKSASNVAFIFEDRFNLFLTLLNEMFEFKMFNGRKFLIGTYCYSPLGKEVIKVEQNEIFAFHIIGKSKVKRFDSYAGSFIEFKPPSENSNDDSQL